MLEIESAFKSYFQNQVFQGDYNFSNATFGVPDNDSDVAKIREFLQGNVSDVRLSAQNANATTLMSQMFVDSAATIRNKLIQMEQVATKAANGYYTDTDKASTQQQFEQAAKDINDIVDATKYDNNKLFTANGQTISQPLGNGQAIHFFARDLSVDTTNMDLATDPKAAQAAIRTALKEANKYVGYLSSQNTRLQDSMARIENRMAGATGIEQGDFGIKNAYRITSNLATKIQNKPHISSQIQANITANEALHLLRDN
jgi:flagellin-like hook-associated protein FlgL